MNFKNKFVDSEPQNHTEFKKDHDIQSEVRTERFQKALVHIVLDAYVKYRTQRGIDGIKNPADPAEVIMAKKAWVSEDDQKGHAEQFLEDYEFTDDPKDYVFSKDIISYANKTWSNKLTSTKFMRELKLYINTKTFNNVERKNKSQGGKKNSAWVGLREKPEAPYYSSFSNKCQSNGWTLDTTQEEYTEGSDESGVHFCPTISCPQHGTMDSRSIESWEREWGAGRD